MTLEELKQKLDELVGKPFDRWHGYSNQNTFGKLLKEYAKQFLSNDVLEHTYTDVDHNNITLKMFGNGFSNYTIISVKTSRKNLALNRWDDAEWVLKSYELPDNIEERCAEVNEMVATSIKIKNDEFTAAKKDFEALRGFFPDKSDYEIVNMLENILKYKYDMKEEIK